MSVIAFSAVSCVPFTHQREIVSFPHSEEPIFIQAKSNDFDQLTQMAETLELMKPFVELTKNQIWLKKQVPHFDEAIQEVKLKVGVLPTMIHHKNGKYYKGHALGFDLITKGVTEPNRNVAQARIKKHLYQIANRDFKVLRISKL